MALIDPIFDKATALLACLEEQYPGQGTPPANFCLRAGENATVVEDLDPFTQEDLCCQGLGWVRMGLSVPSSNFPEPDTALKKHSCLPVGWATELEVGILRCYVPGVQPGMATCPQHTQAATNYATDMRTIKQAICCWVKTLPKGALYEIIGIGPSGPRTNCIMTVGQLVVRTARCC